MLYKTVIKLNDIQRKRWRPKYDRANRFAGKFDWKPTVHGGLASCSGVQSQKKLPYQSEFVSDGEANDSYETKQAVYIQCLPCEVVWKS